MSEQRLNLLEQTVVRMDTKLDGIAETLQSLARIEERQMATNERLRQGDQTMSDFAERLRAIELAMPEKANERLTAIEVQMPGLIESRKWVVMGILSGIGMIGAGVLSLVVRAS
jgi:response regulator RpfG family c-di-GMP phosphodiesterase